MLEVHTHKKNKKKNNKKSANFSPKDEPWLDIGPFLCVKADLYSTRPQVRLGERGKYDVIAVLPEVCFECA